MAVVGLYGVTTHGVEQRRRELAIRVALGAGRREIVGLVLRRAAKVVAAGLAVGLLVALLFTRAISSFLYGVDAADPRTFAIILVLLALVALAASLLPARRATRVQAGAVLRST